MSDLVHLRASDARRVPWKNGRGFTDELAVWPSAASFERGDFDARISRASVSVPGPFSAFPGFDRVLVVTGGGEMLLDHAAHAPAARVAHLAPYAFSGDWPTSAGLPDGPVADFNVLLRRGRAEGSVRAIELRAGDGVREVLGEGHVFVHVLAGGAAATVGRAAPVDLAAGESLWDRGSHASGTLRLDAGIRGCAALLVSMRFRA